MTAVDPSRRGRPPVSEQGRREQRLAVSREAVRLFREHGVAGASGERIAQAAGMSERTLWRLFRSKESCVEPVLSTAIDGFRAALLAWPVELDLAEYLRVTSESASPATRADTDAALAVVRMSRDEPGLRAVWLLLQERAEPTFAEVIGPRMGLPADAPEVRVQAAVTNAALRVLADDVANEAGHPSPALHRERLAAALRGVTRIPAPS